jgi:hypothetical protein
VSRQVLEKLADMPAKYKNKSSEGRTQYLERENPGTGIDICICGLLKSA